jgi:hypothetical protein
MVNTWFSYVLLHAAARGQDQEEDLEPRHAHVPDDGALAAGAGDEE